VDSLLVSPFPGLLFQTVLALSRIQLLIVPRAVIRLGRRSSHAVFFLLQRSVFGGILRGAFGSSLLSASIFSDFFVWKLLEQALLTTMFPMGRSRQSSLFFGGRFFWRDDVDRGGGCSFRSMSRHS